MRALGLAMRIAERRGWVESIPDLRLIVEASGFTAEEIDQAFDLLVTDDGFTIGSTVELSELDGVRIGALVLDGMIEIGDDGHCALAECGAAFSELLDEYADPNRLWLKLPLQSGRESVAVVSEAGEGAE
jgi:hypothetical protein